MKKLLFLLIVLPFVLVSCDDDNEMPNVDFKVEISGGKNVDGVIYVLKGDTLTINDIFVESKDDRNAAMGAVSFFWDGQFLYTKQLPPYRIQIFTEKMILPNHIFEFNCPLYVEDSPILTAYFRYPVKLVNSVDSIPNTPSQPITSGFRLE